MDGEGTHIGVDGVAALINGPLAIRLFCCCGIEPEGIYAGLHQHQGKFVLRGHQFAADDAYRDDRLNFIRIKALQVVDLLNGGARTHLGIHREGIAHADVLCGQVEGDAIVRHFFIGLLGAVGDAVAVAVGTVVGAVDEDVAQRTRQQPCSEVYLNGITSRFFGECDFQRIASAVAQGFQVCHLESASCPGDSRTLTIGFYTGIGGQCRKVSHTGGFAEDDADGLSAAHFVKLDAQRGTAGAQIGSNGHHGIGVPAAVDGSEQAGVADRGQCAEQTSGGCQ